MSFNEDIARQKPSAGSHIDTGRDIGTTAKHSIAVSFDRLDAAIQTVEASAGALVAALSPVLAEANPKTEDSTKRPLAPCALAEVLLKSVDRLEKLARFLQDTSSRLEL